MTTGENDDMKIMIVEDNAQVRKMMRSFLGDIVDEFVECADGCEALKAYSEHRPDLVLMDIKMKQMDGFAATREIKAMFPDARVVIVSHWDSQPLREQARLAGAGQYISKADLLPLRDVLISLSS
jgi:CheY-like chemotaxis protein